VIADGRTLKPGTILDYDICIVGSGPAGITLGMELAESRKRICILEAGGTKADKPELEEFFSGENVGLPYNLTDCRSRRFGGTSDQWSGFMAMFDALDFKENRYVPRSGWPISYEGLLPYYKRVYQRLGFTPFEFDPDKLARPGCERISFKADEVTSKVWHFNSLNFADHFGKALDQSASIDVYLHSTLTCIRLDRAGARVSHLEVATAPGATFTVRAKAVVLACGGMENARVLLSQDRPAGSALANDNIGRFFMEHPHYLKSVTLMLFSPHANSQLYEVPAQMQTGTVLVCAFFQLGGETRQRLGLPNAVFRAQRPSIPPKVNPRVAMTMRHLYGSAGNAERLSPIVIMVEQFPNPDSRITLSDKPDKYGVPRIRFNWQLTREEIKKTVQSTSVFGLKLGENGLGRLRIDAKFARGKMDGRVDYGWHHMGATRMALSARDGVVDPDCKVFGLDNLYIAGSSVFPTSGCANPTFTLLAMTIRLADHLKAKSV
jgi:choline dehydrogenase-like flavoprotein